MRLLVIEDSPLDFRVLVLHLQRQCPCLAVRAERVETREALAEALAAAPWDLVISDHQLPGFTSALALEMVRALPAPPPFIIVSGVIGEEAAVEAMRRGADDYLVKGRLARLGMAVTNALAAASLKREKALAEAQLRQSQAQLRNLSSRLQALLDAERSAIARDIHDDICGSLTAVRFDLDLLERHVTPGGAERLQRARGALQQATATARRILRDLRPPILDDGLAHAIESLACDFRERTGLAVRYDSDMACAQLPAEAAMAAYRTCQEALTNVIKHANATEVHVDLHCSHGLLTLEVSDNGRGLAAGALLKPESLGLRGLAERALAAGGSLDVCTANARTTLLLWLPVGPMAAETDESPSHDTPVAA